MTRLTVTVAALALLVVMAGCQLNNAPSHIEAGNLTYFRDAKAGLCFAAMNSTTYSEYNVTSITAIPCDKMPNQF